MTRSRTLGAPRLPYRTRLFLAALAVLTLLFLGLLPVQAAEALIAADAPQGADTVKKAKPVNTTLSDDDQKCLECHAKPKLEKILDNGDKLSLYIKPRAFAESVHNSEGCEGCHSDIEADTHGEEIKAVASKRAQSVAMMESCRDCHKKPFK